MSSIVYQTNKKTGAKYAYESISYWDKEKKQPRSKRKYIGRVDPETGGIIRKGEKQDKGESVNTSQSQDLQMLRDEITEKNRQIVELKKQMAILSEKYHRTVKTVKQINSLSELVLEE